MLEELLPPPIAVVERNDDPEVDLYPEEAAVLGNAVDKRRREFSTARWCAREALKVLGLPPAPILPGPKREPLWPSGVVGAITHCTGYRAVALAHASDFSAIGIDAEPHAPAPDGVLKAIAIQAEQDRMPELVAADPDICWDRLLFSAKESVYKAWFPVAQKWLGFEDADITLDPSGTFKARILLPDAPVSGYSGQWLVRDGILLTAIAVPA